MKKMTDTDASTKTIQFLMGLNEGYDAVRNQILMQEPLPNVNEAYAMLQDVESQRMIQKNFEEVLEPGAMMLRTQNYGKGSNKGPFKRKDADRKEAQGLLKETCFQLSGYPEWYVDLMKARKDKKNMKQVNMIESVTDQEKSTESKQQEWMSDFI